MSRTVGAARDPHAPRPEGGAGGLAPAPRKPAAGLGLLRVLWAPAAVYLLHVLISRATDLYRTHPVIDMPMHVLGGVAIAHAVFTALDLLAARGRLEPVAAAIEALLGASLTGIAAIGWEIFEFTTDSLGWTRSQVGLEDTLLDLVLGVAGGAAWSLVRWGSRRRRR